LQVWDAATGGKLYTFDGHEAPVYSVCPHHKENIQVGGFFPFFYYDFDEWILSYLLTLFEMNKLFTFSYLPHCRLKRDDLWLTFTIML